MGAAVAVAVAAPRRSMGDVWGGSAALTSDYFVRGISRSDNHPAVQADYHFLSAAGFLAGAFASTAEIYPKGGADAELNAFVGFTWSADDEWHGKIIAGHYAYLGNQHGAHYDYDELALDEGFQDWLDLTVVYSPNFARFVPFRGLTGTASTSTEVNLQHAVYKKLFVTSGAGYSFQSGPGAAGYVYWSIGAAYEWAPLALAVSYVNTSASAKSLFYDEAARGRWLGTVIWRF
jgi:uncharacterized protein (TIGR02001 family)